MNKNAYAGLAIGVAIGVGMGWRVGSVDRGDAAHGEPALIATNTTAAVTATNAPPKEKELLLMAINELNLTSGELEEARAYIAKLERGARRYDWLRGFWKEHGTASAWNLNMGYQQAPSKEFIEFMGWDEETARLVKAAGARTTTAVKNWEKENAVKVEVNDPSMIWMFEIPPAPSVFSEEYLANMRALIGEEDYDLISANLEKPLENLSHPRKVSCRYTTMPGPTFGNQDPDARWVHVQEEIESDAPFPVFGNSVMMREPKPNADGTTPFVFHNWSHLTDEAPSGFEMGAGGTYYRRAVD